jgi:hypothetical protein
MWVHRSSEKLNYDIEVFVVLKFPKIMTRRRGCHLYLSCLTIDRYRLCLASIENRSHLEWWVLQAEENVTVLLFWLQLF